MKSTVETLLILLAVLGSIGGALAESPSLWGDLEAGPHDVGFRLIEEVDRSRAIRVQHPSPVVRPRPIRVYVWYPAKLTEADRPMTFGRYATMADGDVWPDDVLAGARDRMAYEGRPFARSVGEERYAELLEQPVRAVEDAEAAAGRFPLIVIGQGLYYESPVSHAILGELLASHGYVVATSPLVGTHSLLVHLDVVDLETQVRDMEFVVRRVREESFVSPERLGLFGFDMGGMSAVVLAMRNPDVDAFVSVDAGILYGHASHIPSGIPFTSPHFDPDLLRAPWLHATQRRFAAPPPEHEGATLFEDAKHSDRYLVLVDGMRHTDFTSYALVQDRDPIRGYWPPEQGGEKERYEAVCLYVSSFFRSYLSGDESGRAFLSRDPAETVPGIPLTIEHRRATPPGPVYADYLNALLAGDLPGAGEIASAVRAGRPDGALSEETVLIRLGYHLLSSWGMSDEGVAVFRLNTELHPQSVDAWSVLGDGYLWIDDRDGAARVFEKVLELDPENDFAKRMLERLGASPPPDS
jgi:dienelactone hydrolase